jgi:hypothetical protein
MGNDHRHMKVRGTFASTAALAALLMLGTAPASADPKSEFTRDLICDSIGTVTVAAFSNGDPSPGLVLGSNQVIQPYVWEVTLHATPYVGDPFTRVFSYSRGEPQSGRLDYCTYHYEVFNSIGHGVFDGWALISYTP